MSPREDFVYEYELPADVNSAENVKVQVQGSGSGGTLWIHVAGAERGEEVLLPEDAYTDDAQAHVDKGKLVVRIPRRDPQGPALTEKRMFNPDKHPVDVEVHFPHSSQGAHRARHHRAGGAGAATAADRPHEAAPADAELREHDPRLYGDPGVHARGPAAGMMDSVVTSNPVIINKGGAVETVSKGETVVPVGGTDRVELMNPAEDLGPAQVAEALRETRIRDAPPRGAGVLYGQRELELDRAFGSRDQDAPFDRVRVDFKQEKVGMEEREATAADFYPSADRRDIEPHSSVKQAGELCDMCECNPCQCDKVATGRVPFELTPQEQKRSGRPHLNNPNKGVTADNAHHKPDLRMHAQPRDIHHAHVGHRLEEFKGNVPEGAGEWSNYTPDKYHRTDKHAAHAGGSVIGDVGDMMRARDQGLHVPTLG